jgi:hypothetical protein
MAPDPAESLGRIVRETWVRWALEQPDVGEHPSWTEPWDELDERDREVDVRIGAAVAAAERDRIVAVVDDLACHAVPGTVRLALENAAAVIRGQERGDEGEARDG